MPSKNCVFVTGHLNPDTDSICSSIAYAYLKREATGDAYEARRAGSISPESQFVLDYFGVEPQPLLEDVRQRVRDIDYRLLEPVEEMISVREAWEYMRANNVVSVAVKNAEGEMSGMITMGDITKSYMEVYDNTLLGDAGTPYVNLLYILDGQMVVGEPDGVIDKGKVIVAAANPDVMENYVEEGDIVLLGNRYDTQLCAVEMGAQCIIIANDASCSRSIKRFATEHHCRVIESPYDTYTMARLMNQSVPVRYFMTGREKLLGFSEEDFLDDVSKVMGESRHRYFPITDENGRYLGIMSRRNLISAKKQRLILVDHNERSQAVHGLEEAEILEIIDHHRIGGLETMGPIYFRNQPVGCTATILYQMFQEKQVPIPRHIAGLMLSAILSDTLAFRSPTCTIVDKMTAEALAKLAEIPDIEEYAIKMFSAANDLAAKSAEEILYMDFKRFKGAGKEFCIGQITSMSASGLEIAKEKMMDKMWGFLKDQKADMMFFMLTNILTESSEVIFVGEQSGETIMKGFHPEQDVEKLDLGTAILPGVVSRKKQMVPTVITALGML